MTPPYDAPEEEESADGADEHDEPDGDEGGDDSYKMAGRSIRHAIADGDDAGLAEAICHLIDIHTSGGDEEAPAKKPNLAILLAEKKRK